MIRVSVIIPVYNEKATILEVLRRVQAQRFDDFELETIVIDDGSKDGSADLLREHPDLYTRLVARPKNGGKGAAVRDGLRAATGDYILFQDADLEYDPADYANLFLPVRRFNADIVMASRFLSPAYTRVHYFWHKVGNRLLTLTFNIMFNTTFDDIYTCYLMYRRSLVDPEKLETEGFEQQAEILAKAVKSGKGFYDVPASYHGRTYEEGKKIHWYHAFAVFWTIVRERFR